MRTVRPADRLDAAIRPCPPGPRRYCELMSISDCSFSGFGLSLHLDGPLHHEHRDIQDVLTDFERLRIVVALRRAHENRPEPAIEQQRRVHVLVGAVPVGLNFNQLACRHQQRLRFDFAGRRRSLGGASVGLAALDIHDLNGELCRTRASELPMFYTSAAFKIWLAVVSKCVGKPRHPQSQAYRPRRAAQQKTAGFPPPFRSRF